MPTISAVTTSTINAPDGVNVDESPPSLRSLARRILLPNPTILPALLTKCPELYLALVDTEVHQVN